MLRLGLTICAVAGLALAEGFTFTIGSPVAAQDRVAKNAAFVFRTEGCAEPAKAQVSASAEGRVKGARRSIDLPLTPLATPGVYAVNQVWPPEGEWLVRLKGVCGAATAGALVPIGPRGFLRESAKFFPRAATDSETEAALQSLAPGGKK